MLQRQSSALTPFEKGVVAPSSTKRYLCPCCLPFSHFRRLPCLHAIKEGPLFVGSNVYSHHGYRLDSNSNNVLKSAQQRLNSSKYENYDDDDDEDEDESEEDEGERRRRARRMGLSKNADR